MLKFKQFVSYLKESLTDEAMILERSNVEKLHFEMDPKKAEKLKTEIGYAQGETSKRNQIEGANYSLRRFRKEIGYWDGNKRDQEWAEGVFAGPEHYNTIKSTLGAGPHKKKVKVKRWNQKLYDKWIKDMATNNDGVKQSQDYGFEMAQNANFENGLIDWVKKNNRGEDPLQIIQWDIEGMMESTVNEGKMPDKYIGNDEIVFLKTKEDNRGAHYNLYYKGHDIEKGGARFGSEKELKAFADDYILSNQLYNKLKYEDSKPLPESVIEENLNEAIKYETKGYKLGDKIKTNFGEWEIIETDYKPNKSFTSPFVFKGDKLEKLPVNVKSTEKTAVGYKVTDGAKYPIYGFLYQYKGKLGNKMLITKLATIGVDESVVTEAKNTIGLAFKDEDDYTGFVEFIKDEKGSIKKDFGWDSKTKSWEVIMDVKVLDRIYGEGTSGNKESGWYGALPGDFESVIIESVVTEARFNYKETGLSGQNLKDVKDGITGIKNALKRGNESAVISNYDLVQQRLQQHGGPKASEFLKKIKQLAGLDESVVNEAKHSSTDFSKPGNDGDIYFSKREGDAVGVRQGDKLQMIMFFEKNLN